MKRFPRIQKLFVHQHADEDQDCMNSMLALLPQLTELKVDSNATLSMQSRDWSNLLRLNHLTTLSFTRVTAVQLDSLQSKETLKSLALCSASCCNETSLSALKTFPVLTQLDLSNNDSIQNSHIVTLLQDCLMLKVLTLRGCYRITWDLLNSIESTSLQYLIADRTRIKKENLPQELIASLTYHTKCYTGFEEQ